MDAPKTPKTPKTPGDSRGNVDIDMLLWRFAMPFEFDRGGHAGPNNNLSGGINERVIKRNCKSKV